MENLIRWGSSMRLTKQEVKNEWVKVKNGEAAGLEEIPGELLNKKTPKLYSQLKEL